MERILVTGGAGFLGSHLCEYLLRKKEHVICLDDLYTGRKENIMGFMKNPDFEFIEHDVTEYIDIPIDQIYNLACPASPPHYQKDPIKTLTTNVFGISNMLDLARKYDASYRLVQAKSMVILKYIHNRRGIGDV